MKNQETVIFAKVYDFKNDEGQLVQGGEIHILGKKSSVTSDFGVSSGHKVSKTKVPLEMAQQIIGQVPAVFDVEYDVDINRDSALVLKPKTFTLVKEIKLF